MDAGALRLAPDTLYIYIHLAAHLGLLYVQNSEVPDGTLTKLLVAVLNSQHLTKPRGLNSHSGTTQLSIINYQLSIINYQLI